MNYPIKVIYLHDENQYYCFVDGMVGIDGVGITEELAIENFYITLNKLMRER